MAGCPTRSVQSKKKKKKKRQLRQASDRDVGILNELGALPL
jgi:hypothetical protein